MTTIETPTQYPLLEAKRWKHPDSYMGEQYDNCFVMYSRTGDSGILLNSNYETILDRLGITTTETDTEFTACFGHWACGHVDAILIREDSPKLAECEAILSEIEDYPSLDEDDYFEREIEEMHEAWAQMDRRERLQIIRSGIIKYSYLDYLQGADWHTMYPEWAYETIQNYVNY